MNYTGLRNRIDELERQLHDTQRDLEQRSVEKLRGDLLLQRAERDLGEARGVIERQQAQAAALRHELGIVQDEYAKVSGSLKEHIAERASRAPAPRPSRIVGRAAQTAVRVSARSISRRGAWAALGVLAAALFARSRRP